MQTIDFNELIAAACHVGPYPLVLIEVPGVRRTVEQETFESGGEFPIPEKSKASIAPLEVPSGNCVVLLAEDNMANNLTIGDYLNDHGYEIVSAHDGLEAIEKAEEIKPDIILMDIQMPTMNGLDAIHRLRQNPLFRSTPIIALTALAMPGDRERCLQAGANEYLSKPVSLKRLLKTIGDLI
jgi:CheY-like chemotaxis protein